MSDSNCCFLTCIQISQEAGKVVWYSYLFKAFPHFFFLTHTVKGFNIINEAEDVFMELSIFQWSNRCWQFDPWLLCLLQIGSEHLEVLGSHTVETYLGEFWSSLCYHVKWVQLCGSMDILWLCPSLELDWKLTFSSPIATSEFSKFSGILSTAG